VCVCAKTNLDGCFEYVFSKTCYQVYGKEKQNDKKLEN